MKVPKSSRKAPLAKAADTGDKGVVERRQDPTRRNSLLLDPSEFFVLLGDPSIHELAKEVRDPRLRLFTDHRGWVVQRARQTRTSSKNSPARRPVLRLTCRFRRSSRARPACSRIAGYKSRLSLTTITTGEPDSMKRAAFLNVAAIPSM